MPEVDLEKIFDEKLNGLKIQIAHINSRIDNQVSLLKYLVGGLVFPLIILAITLVLERA